jgi:hypothetical protein
VVEGVLEGVGGLGGEGAGFHGGDQRSHELLADLTREQVADGIEGEGAGLDNSASDGAGEGAHSPALSSPKESMTTYWWPFA